MPSGYPLPALARLAELLEGCGARWVVGGSTGLAIRGAVLDREPRDLDVYADREAVPLIHRRLAEWALDGPEDNETERYRSVLSHYGLGGSPVELVGDFRVTALDSSYHTEVEAFLYPNGETADAGGRTVRLVPLGHELVFNLLRERTDRAIVAGRLMAADEKRHLSILGELLARNRIADAVARRAYELARSFGG